MISTIRVLEKGPNYLIMCTLYSKGKSGLMSVNMYLHTLANCKDPIYRGANCSTIDCHHILLIYSEKNTQMMDGLRQELHLTL